ncbi:uncharacterized protein LOC144316276 isoform X2 [Canis aureus]
MELTALLTLPQKGNQTTMGTLLPVCIYRCGHLKKPEKQARQQNLSERPAFQGLCDEDESQNYGVFPLCSICPTHGSSNSLICLEKGTGHS